jgi:hypothetical protein
VAKILKNLEGLRGASTLSLATAMQEQEENKMFRSTKCVSSNAHRGYATGRRIRLPNGSMLAALAGIGPVSKTGLQFMVSSKNASTSNHTPFGSVVTSNYSGGLQKGQTPRVTTAQTTHYSGRISHLGLMHECSNGNNYARMPGVEEANFLLGVSPSDLKIRWRRALAEIADNSNFGLLAVFAGTAERSRYGSYHWV